VDFPVTGERELGEHLAIHDASARVSYGAQRWTAMSSGKSSGQLGARSRRPARAARMRFRRAQLTSPERPTLAPSRPAQPWRRHRDPGPRGEWAPPACRVRSARSADDPRPRRQLTPSRQRPSRDDRQCPDPCHQISRDAHQMVDAPSASRSRVDTATVSGRFRNCRDHVG
jgi:hypothetical protein